MQAYLDLLRHVRQHGIAKDDRTGTGTLSVFGWQMRFDLSEGFPLVTTKKLHLRSIIHELIWFLKGDTNIGYLKDNGVNIWDEWAIKEDETVEKSLTNYDRVVLRAEKLGITVTESKERAERDDYIVRRMGLTPSSHGGGEPNGGEKILDDEGIPRTRQVIVRPKGDLGPVYGKQWRSWVGANGKTFDQIAWVIEELKRNPDSRRLVVSAWNVADLDKMALHPCHCLFQFYTTPMDRGERLRMFWQDERFEQQRRFAGDPEEYSWDDIEDYVLDEAGIPTRKLSCQLYQRSGDIFLGVPFNIASYALLTHMVAQVVNMGVGEYIHTLGDAHIYSNHLEQADLQLTRSPRDLPTLCLNPEIQNIFDFKFEDVTIEGYDPHPAIKAPVAV